MAKDNLNNRLADLEKSRELIYGSFASNMKKIAKVWSVILDDELADGVPLARQIPAHKVALMYAAAKIVRASNRYKQDSYDDALQGIMDHNAKHPLSAITPESIKRSLKRHMETSKNIAANKGISISPQNQDIINLREMEYDSDYNFESLFGD